MFFSKLFMLANASLLAAGLSGLGGLLPASVVEDSGCEWTEASLCVLLGSLAPSWPGVPEAFSMMGIHCSAFHRIGRGKNGLLP
jgi:hypothetical protein